MDERPTKRGGPLYWLKRRSRRFWIANIVAAMPVLYVASTGPVIWINVHIGGGIQDVAGLVYAPLIWLHVKEPKFAELWEPWSDFWNGR
jgi:hypothetical protein